MKKVYYDLWRMTEQQCGIVIYDTNILCLDWANINGLPSMLGDIPIGFGEEITIKKKYRVKDVRTVLPGTIVVTSKEVQVDGMTILYDRFYDMLAVFGFKVIIKDDKYEIHAAKGFKPIAGTVFEVDSGAIVIAPDGWN